MFLRSILRPSGERRVKTFVACLAGALVGVSFVAASLNGQQTPAPVRPQTESNRQGRQVSLKEQLRVGLKAKTKADFAFIELCTLPMFLFSATFVPADTYPDVVRWLLPLTPLYHGVELLRAFTLGDVTWLVLVNIAYLVALTGIFLVLADRRLAKLLLK